jgi:hypothetical protein
MEFITKFNRSFLKAIQSNKVQVIDYNAGAVREASLKFKFTHDGEKHCYALSSKRTVPGLDDFGYPEKLVVELTRWNPSYLHGISQDMPADIDPVGLDYLKNKSVVPREKVLLVRRIYQEAVNNYIEQMI